MPLPAETLQRILDSIEAQNLVILCGAGLSMPAPSKLMSAVDVSRVCYDAYAPTQVLPAALRDDIDQLAGHFFANDQFERLFINRLVPWGDLTGQPNVGHAAVADLLLSGAVTAVLSANFDMMIEQWSWQRKVDIRGALDGAEAVKFTSTSKPLLKFHGCMTRARETTLWTRAQLNTPTVEHRIDGCKRWMGLNLPGRDLFVVGFWTDWGYLNDVLADAFTGGATASVTVVDPSPTDELAEKAPDLWATLSASPNFQHVQASGDAVLNEVRTEFTKVWTRKLYVLGCPLYENEKGSCPAEILKAPDLEVDALYTLRCDAEGVASNRAARSFEPGPSAAQTGYAHLLFTSKANARNGSWYEVNGRTIRVVNGAGEGLTTVQNRFNEPPAAPKADVVVCVGALDQGVPGTIISKGHGANAVRPRPGGGSCWMTLDKARAEFAL